MKKNWRKRLFGNIRLILLGCLALICVLFGGLLVHWQPGRTIKRQQASLIRSIEARKPARFQRLLANDYKDRWGFGPENLAEAVLDVNSQFLTMRLTPEDSALEVSGKDALVTVRLKVGGTPIGAGAQIVQLFNRLEEPFVFKWEKQSFLPSSWRLVSVENPSIPDNAWNYLPGSIRAAMKSGDF